MRKLLLFDIDGTLLLTGGAGLRAMTLAFEELFGIPDAFDGIPMPGRTDTAILASAAATHQVPPAELDRFHDVYLSHLAREIERPERHKRMMPGIRPLLDTLAGRDDAYVALLTGNYEQAARIKLEYFDLWRYFPCGAFGDDAADRNALAPKAMERVRACGGPVVEPKDAVVIGDTPLDVACATAIGARSVAVATGFHDAETLRQSGAHIVFDDFSDTQAVVDALL